MVLTTADLVGAIFGAMLTLMVFSYLLGDNPAFRLSVHLFVGVSTGLAAAIALRNAVIPGILLPLLDFSDPLQWFGSLVLLILAVMMLFKISPRLGRVGNIPIAFIAGVGAAVVVSGAVIGTIFPQVEATAGLFDLSALPTSTPISSLLALTSRFLAVLGTVATLAYFHFSTRTAANDPREQVRVNGSLARIGRLFIAVTFGALFAGVFSAALAAWVERWDTIIAFLTTILGALGGS